MGGERRSEREGVRGEGEKGEREKVGMSTHTSCLATCTCAHNGADSAPFPHVPTPRQCGVSCTSVCGT